MRSFSYHVFYFHSIHFMGLSLFEVFSFRVTSVTEAGFALKASKEGPQRLAPTTFPAPRPPGASRSSESICV